MSKTWNFTAGPCMLPPEVMTTAQQEFLDYHGMGIGIIEASHRGAEFDAIAKNSEKLLRKLMNIPDNYRVLFMQSGGRGQFSAIPLNLLPEDGFADYFITGHWSRCAFKECDERFGKAVAHECLVRDEEGIYHVDYSKMEVTKGAAYAYVCFNETVNGIEMFDLPDTGSVPLIADMSSDILTRVIDVRRFGAIIFGVQKNVAPSGLVIAIVREDLLGHSRKYCPSILDWSVMNQYDSLFNTPCTFAWYMADLVFQWIDRLGGVLELEKRNIAKAELLYGYIDSTDFYRSVIAFKDRSRVNCVFTLKDDSLSSKFLAEAKEHHLIGLKGHKVLGGMRASLYNAMPIEGVQALVDFMKEFEKANS
ncbi:MAG: 3-phosphoserine/phosphohydroxythreonine transaminase [Succinivibrio sp.]|nr:3-phosphoserine/phosphohydroxythreonine transaminase [Succinivibrio sp.]